MKKSSKRLIVIFSSLVFIPICITVYYYWNKEEVTDDHQTPVKEVTLDEQDINNLLPMTMEVAKTDTERETIAYRLWFDLMGALKKVAYSRMHIIPDSICWMGIKFTSEDEGKTWALASLVDPENMLGE